jgi:hypothetical protein
MSKNWNWKTTVIPAVGAAIMAFLRVTGWASADQLITLGSLVTFLTGWAAKDCNN